MHAWALSARSNYAIIILQGPDCTVSKVGGPALGVVVSETLNASIIDTRADQKPAVTRSWEFLLPKSLLASVSFYPPFCHVLITSQHHARKQAASRGPGSHSF